MRLRTTLVATRRGAERTNRGEVPGLGVDGGRRARIGFRTLLVFADGFVPAGLRPGDILVDGAGKVIILDLGLTA